MNEWDYELDNEYLCINIPSMNKGDNYEVLLKYPTATDSLSIDARSATRCSIFNEFESRPYFWGTSKQNVMYVGKYLSKDKLDSSRTILRCVGLYVTDDDVVELGEGRDEKIMAIVKHFGRTVVFTKNDAWRSDDPIIADDSNSTQSTGAYISGEPLKFSKINDSVGVYSDYGAISVNNYIISIEKNSILKWNVDLDELNEKTAIPISESIDPLITDDFRKNSSIYFDSQRNVVYFYSKNDPCIWVWCIDSEKWVCFDGFSPHIFFDYGEKTAFVYNEKICYFDESLSQDVIYSKSYPIIAYFKTNPIDFDNFEDKHLIGINTKISNGDFNCMLYFNNEKYSSQSFSVSPTDNSYNVFNRISSRRFKCVSLQISTKSPERQSLYSLEITAR